MINLSIVALGLAISAGQAWARPSALGSTLGSTKPAGLGRWDTWTIPNPDYVDGAASNHSESLLATRQAGAASECDVGQGVVVVRDENAADGQRVQAFSILFDSVRDNLCVDLGCSPRDMTCISATPTQDICITARGDFPRADRSYYIDGTRELFDRTVMYGWADPASGNLFPGATEWGTDQIYLRRTAGGFLQIELTIVEKQGAMCPNFISLITGAGSLGGPAAPFFGLIQLLCDSIPSGTIGG